MDSRSRGRKCSNPEEPTLTLTTRATHRHKARPGRRERRMRHAVSGEFPSLSPGPGAGSFRAGRRRRGPRTRRRGVSNLNFPVLRSDTGTPVGSRLPRRSRVSGLDHKCPRLPRPLRPVPTLADESTESDRSALCGSSAIQGGGTCTHRLNFVSRARLYRGDSTVPGGPGGAMMRRG
eukprot:762440-Hanusia_phi.AAC.4